jgi:MFS family permease
MMVGVIGQGVGAGAIIVPSLPDAQDGLSTEVDKAAVVAVWNSCLAGGGAVGPVLAAALTERYGFDLMAAVFAGWCVLALLALGASGWRGGKASASAGVSIYINEAIEPPITPINEAVDRRANAIGT